MTDLQKRCSDMAAKLQDERSTSIYRAEQIQLLQEQVQELQARVPEVDMDDVVAAGNLAAVHHSFTEYSGVQRAHGQPAGQGTWS